MGRDVAAEVLAKEKQRVDALLAGDNSALAGLLSERLMFAHANATLDSKATLLEKMASGRISYVALTVSDTHIVELGDSALLFSHLQAEVLVGGTAKTIDNRTLSVWTLEDDEWRLIAYQPTGVPKV